MSFLLAVNGAQNIAICSLNGQRFFCYRATNSGPFLCFLDMFLNQVGNLIFRKGYYSCYILHIEVMEVLAGQRRTNGNHPSQDS